MLGNLYDYDPAKDGVLYSDLSEIDRWALHKGQKMLQKVLNAYRDYEFHILFYAIHHFCVVDMSNFYLDVIKDRLYTCSADSRERRTAQTVMHKLLSILVRLIAPVLSFTAEEIWQYMPGDKEDRGISVQLEEFPKVNPEEIDQELEGKYGKILDVRYEVARALERARNEKVIGHSLDAKVNLYVDDKLHEFLKPIEKELPFLFIVSQVEVMPPGREAGEEALEGEELKNLKVTVTQAEGQKCERCWNYSTTVGKVKEHPGICTRCAANLE